ncbi:snake venom 5'-nucleotidase isoform X2 [Cydia pomonella]|uniref:snake venom 5'-nucleotidase isoform X2 n=1 Tax=Cydia pomonella TaxID=82600 RepID=UPI002ADD7D24|nr:snake venom 5'-nucleotidase isoform X2 [Cydia pomonella]XP_061724375.1 snake venom 5'-nucleotidase isoform X2 [Cydia pomonella]
MMAVRGMASFAAQAALRSRWSSLIESTSVDVPGEVTDGVRSVVGWLKQASLEVRQVGRRAVSQLSGRGMDDVLIIHYNDVYNIEQTTKTEPVGGALRFSTAVKAMQHLNPLVLFSGDVFSPSMLSTYTKGEQMVPVLNEIGTHCAVFGNHDFDFGLEVLSGLVAQCNFPWLMSNVIDNETGRPLGDGRITHALLCNGHKIGLIGLVEQEWLETLATINPEEVTFIDFLQAGAKLSEQLKQEGCEYVIALTHMRTPNDIKLAEGNTEIDLILGGHDHVYEVIEVNNKYIVKSGTDFRQFSKINISFGPDSTRVDIADVHVTSSFAEDPVLKAKTDKYSAMIEGKMDEVLGKFCVPLEGRFSCIRRQECNLGNWICDVLLAATGADLVLLNSGTFRSDQVHPAGDFTLRDLGAVIPMRDPLVLLEATGADVLQALENSVSQYPSLEGRFPQVAGISFAFDPTKPVGSRVAEQVVKIGDEYLQREQRYRLAVKDYLYKGNDGFNMLPGCRLLVSEDLCPEIGLAVQNHFAAINVRSGRARASKHRQSLVTLSRRHSLVKMLDVSELDGPPPLRRASSAAEPPAHPPPHPHHRLTRRASLDDLEQQSCELAPKVENRIILIDKPETLQALLAARARWEADTAIAEVDDENSP